MSGRKFGQYCVMEKNGSVLCQGEKGISSVSMRIKGTVVYHGTNGSVLCQGKNGSVVCQREKWVSNVSRRKGVQ